MRISRWQKVDDLLQASGLTGIDKSKVSCICKEVDEVVQGFRNRPLLGAYPYVWLDALYLNVRQDDRIVSQAVIVAIGVRATGERGILGFTLGASEEYDFSLQGRRDGVAGLSELSEAERAAGGRAAYQ